MYEGPEFRHLRYFVAVAEECSFSRAAHRLHVSQPALSTQIRQLEEGLGTSLFMRTPVGASLTPSGHALLPYARQLLTTRRQAMEHAKQLHTSATLPLRFGYSPWIMRDIVREAINGFKEMVPGSRVEASSRVPVELMKMVSHGSLDAALVELPITTKTLVSQSVCSERLAVCLRADDPHAQNDLIEPEAVVDQLKIMFERDTHPALYAHIEQRLSRHGIRLEPTDIVVHPAEMQSLVKEGVGWGLIREREDLDPALTVRPIAGVNLTVHSGLIFHEQQQRPVLPLLAHRIAKRCDQRNASAAAQQDLFPKGVEPHFTGKKAA